LNRRLSFTAVHKKSTQKSTSIMAPKEKAPKAKAKTGDAKAKNGDKAKKSASGASPKADQKRGSNASNASSAKPAAKQQPAARQQAGSPKKAPGSPTSMQSAASAPSSGDFELPPPNFGAQHRKGSMTSERKRENL
jgi:hypothetical protein